MELCASPRRYSCADSCKAQKYSGLICVGYTLSNTCRRAHISTTAHDRKAITIFFWKDLVLILHRPSNLPLQQVDESITNTDGKAIRNLFQSILKSTCCLQTCILHKQIWLCNWSRGLANFLLLLLK